MLLAGDIFDSAAPHADDLLLWKETLEDVCLDAAYPFVMWRQGLLRRPSAIPVLAIDGNHELDPKRATTPVDALQAMLPGHFFNIGAPTRDWLRTVEAMRSDGWDRYSVPPFYLLEAAPASPALPRDAWTAPRPGAKLTALIRVHGIPSCDIDVLRAVTSGRDGKLTLATEDAFEGGAGNSGAPMGLLLLHMPSEGDRRLSAHDLGRPAFQCIDAVVQGDRHIMRVRRAEKAAERRGRPLMIFEPGSPVVVNFNAEHGTRKGALLLSRGAGDAVDASPLYLSEHYRLYVCKVTPGIDSMRSSPASSPKVFGVKESLETFLNVYSHLIEEAPHEVQLHVGVRGMGRRLPPSTRQAIEAVAHAMGALSISFFYPDMGAIEQLKAMGVADRRAGLRVLFDNLLLGSCRWDRESLGFRRILPAWDAFRAGPSPSGARVAAKRRSALGRTAEVPVASAATPAKRSHRAAALDGDAAGDLGVLSPAAMHASVSTLFSDPSPRRLPEEPAASAAADSGLSSPASIRPVAGENNNFFVPETPLAFVPGYRRSHSAARADVRGGEADGGGARSSTGAGQMSPGASSGAPGRGCLVYISDTDDTDESDSEMETESGVPRGSAEGDSDEDDAFLASVADEVEQQLA